MYNIELCTVNVIIWISVPT